MPRRSHALALLAGLLAFAPVSLVAQDTTRTRPDSSAMAGHMDDHMMGPWKEMNAFHRVLVATWHPAQKNDLIPLRVRAKELKTLADAWAASKPPEMPVACASEEVRAAVTKIARDSRGLVALLAAEADDEWLVASFKGLHESFEVAEQRCGGHGQE
jgi:hypothetical protein